MDLVNNDATLSEENIKEIESKLKERMVYADPNLENEFWEHPIMDLSQSRDPRTINEFYENKYLNIRRNLNNDDEFIQIKEKLPVINKMHEEEKAKLNELNKQKSVLNEPKEPSRFSKVLFSNKKFHEEKNAYDAKIKEINEQITKVKRLDNIQKNINTLSPVYKKPIEEINNKQDGEEVITAGKRKTRSNRKKSRKSRKSYKKSNHKK